MGTQETNDLKDHLHLLVLYIFYKLKVYWTPVNVEIKKQTSVSPVTLTGLVLSVRFGAGLCGLARAFIRSVPSHQWVKELCLLVGRFLNSCNECSQQENKALFSQSQGWKCLLLPSFLNSKFSWVQCCFFMASQVGVLFYYHQFQYLLNKVKKTTWLQNKCLVFKFPHGKCAVDIMYAVSFYSPALHTHSTFHTFAAKCVSKQFFLVLLPLTPSTYILHFQGFNVVFCDQSCLLMWERRNVLNSSRVLRNWASSGHNISTIFCLSAVLCCVLFVVLKTRRTVIPKMCSEE